MCLFAASCYVLGGTCVGTTDRGGLWGGWSGVARRVLSAGLMAAGRLETAGRGVVTGHSGWPLAMDGIGTAVLAVPLPLQLLLLLRGSGGDRGGAALGLNLLTSASGENICPQV